MKITGWTHWWDNQYEDVFNLNEYNYHNDIYDEIKSLVAEEIKRRKYKFSGIYHQNGEYGVPIIDNKYWAGFSYRGWGSVMAMAYDIKTDMAYCDWAWQTPKDEHEVYPQPDDYKGNIWYT